MLRQMLRDDTMLTKRADTANSDELLRKFSGACAKNMQARSSTRELLAEFAARWPTSLWFEGKTFARLVLG